MCQSGWKRRLAAAAVAALVATAIGGAGPVGAAAPEVNSVRLGVHPGMTRLVLESDRRLTHRVFALAAPRRVVIDLPEVVWRLRGKEPRGKVGVIVALRYGLFQSGTSRVVLDIGRAVKIKKTFVIPPSGGKGFRFVLDLEPADAESFSKLVRRTRPALAPPPRRPAANRIPSRAEKRPQPYRVVAVDPGHGGVDPGAIGRSGVYEKRLTLQVARSVRRELQATGRYKVVLTRDRDVFVRLRHRVEIARDAGAELFLSLHADSIENRRVRGGSVYTLSETASDAEAAALAAKENKADLIAGIDLSGENPLVATILIDLAQRESMNLSAQFANFLVGELARTGRLVRKAHRYAGFAVLKAPDVPAVLVELGYLSNREDERLLRQRAHHQKIAAAVVRAVDRYFRKTASMRP